MIKFSCKHCGQKIRVPEINTGKKGKCPICKNIVVVPKAEETKPAASRIKAGDLELGSRHSDLSPALFDILPKEETSRQPGGQDDVPERTCGKTQRPEGGLAAHEPERVGERRLPWMIDIFLYPASKPGLTMLGIIIGLPLLMKVMTMVVQGIALAFSPLYIFAVVFLCISIIVNIIVALYLYWYLALCVRDSAEGNLRAPDVLVHSPSLGDMFGQLVKLFCCLMIFVLLIYVYVARVRGVGISFWLSLFRALFLIPVELHDAVQSDIIFWHLLFCVVFLFPMTLLAVVMFDSFRAFNPVLIIGSIFSTFFQYCGLVLLFCGICVPIVITRRIVTEKMVLPQFQILPYIIRLVSIYLLMVGAHVLGRFYWRYQEKLDWGV
ncbi:MAG: hypothetical protein ACYSTJ_02335 [Planctomycetota bacterium]|jgi:hypothetical protein